MSTTSTPPDVDAASKSLHKDGSTTEATATKEYALVPSKGVDLTPFLPDLTMLAPYQKLVTDQSTLAWSINVVRLAIFVDSLTGALLQPNYALMARVGAEPESFDSTAPFDFNSATYFIPLTGKLGMAIASLLAGGLSDRVGRKPVLMACMGGSTIFTTLKWILRGSFWGFCAANFANGLVSAGFPVALAYVGELFTDNDAKQKEFGMIGGLFVLGNSAGGILAILMESQGLFAPLWVGVAILALTFVLVTLKMVEAKHLTVLPVGAGGDDDDDDDNNKAPKEMDHLALWNIIIGALADNFGSNGLFPLCLSPLAFNHWTMDFVDAGLEPVLSVVGYKWMSTLVALVVVPATLICPWVYNKIGPAGGCVLGNIITGLLTIALLLLGTQEPTTGWMAAFITVTYVGFPFTVISQLSTGPMLDMVSPPEKRGFVQGLNSFVMNLGGALAPWVLGLLADGTSTEIAIWTGAGLSFFAALVNLPLMRYPGFGLPPKGAAAADDKEGMEAAFDWEDPEIVNKVLRGEYVPSAVLDKINDGRVKQGQPYLIPHATSYEKDKPHLAELRKQARDEFAYMRARDHERLAGLSESTLGEGELAEILKRVNDSLGMTGEPEVQNVYGEVGQWFADYMRDNGYYAHTSPVLVKQMIMAAFPPIMEDKEFTTDNLEQFLTNKLRVANQYVRVVDGERRYTIGSVYGDGHAKVFYG